MGVKNICHICDYCKKTHLISSSTNNRLIKGKQKNCYCSVECKSLSQHTGHDVECAYCHKKFYRRAYCIDERFNKKQNHFCSVKCQMDYRVEQAKEVRFCEICNSEFECKKKSKQRFCSHNCQNKWQTTLTGKSNPRFKQKLTTCTYCNNLFYVQSYKLNNGGRLFCSTDCRRNWFSKIYSQSEDVREMHRRHIIKNFKDGKYDKLETKPQIIINNILDDNKIIYEREYDLTYFCLDNFLVESKLMIEVMGDYWHSNPIKYGNSKSDLQKKIMRKDKAKHTYVNKYYNTEILYLWEYDILNNRELCEKLILEYIEKNGKLVTYHSFNYVLNNEKLNLSKKIIEFEY